MKRLNGFIVGLLVCSGGTLAAEDLRLPPITADIVVDRTFNVSGQPSSEQQSIGKFYRDSAGRTRIDQDGMITINDPVKGVAILLNIPSRMGTTMSLPPSSLQPEAGEPPGGVQERTSLGQQVIEGLEATGVRMVASFSRETFPRAGVDMVQTIEVWHSQRLGIPLLSTLSSLSGQIVTRYTNILENAIVAPELFAIPDGFKLVNP